LQTAVPVGRNVNNICQPCCPIISLWSRTAATNERPAQQLLVFTHSRTPPTDGDTEAVKLLT